MRPKLGQETIGWIKREIRTMANETDEVKKVRMTAMTTIIMRKGFTAEETDKMLQRLTDAVELGL